MWGTSSKQEITLTPALTLTLTLIGKSGESSESRHDTPAMNAAEVIYTHLLTFWDSPLHDTSQSYFVFDPFCCCWSSLFCYFRNVCRIHVRHRMSWRLLLMASGWRWVESFKLINAAWSHVKSLPYLAAELYVHVQATSWCCKGWGESPAVDHVALGSFQRLLITSRIPCIEYDPGFNTYGIFRFNVTLVMK